MVFSAKTGNNCSKSSRAGIMEYWNIGMMGKNGATPE
jgi:hypothetical protein